MKKIKGSDLKVGDWLRSMYEHDPKMKIVKIKRLHFTKWMYDLSVENNENFNANACIVSNSAYFGARITVYLKDVESYIEQNKWKYGNVPLGSI
jgi:hypothetical protein